MNIDNLIDRIRRMKDRDNVRRILYAAQDRDSKLADIEGGKERSRLWVNYAHIKKGDMVFTHVPPRVKIKKRLNKESGKFDKYEVPLHGQYAELWAQPLTVVSVGHRAKKITVRRPGSTKDYTMSVFLCDRLKVSTEPTEQAFSAALAGSEVMAKTTRKK